MAPCIKKAGGHIFQMNNNNKTNSKPDDNFFQELPVTINVEGMKPYTLFMRPLKVKEVQILNRVTYLQEKDPDSEQAGVILLRLMIGTLSVGPDELPAEATSGLITQMIKYNFPDNDNTDSPDNSNQDKKKINTKGGTGLIKCFDFLISNGHSYNNIMNYPIPIFNDFVDTVATRLGLKKEPLDPAAAFQKLGLPINSKGGKK